jgi:hypothetical protein
MMLLAFLLICDDDEACVVAVEALAACSTTVVPTGMINLMHPPMYGIDEDPLLDRSCTLDCTRSDNNILF